MKFVPLPDTRKGVTKEQLAELRSMGVLPSSLGAFANLAHFAEVGGLGMPAEGPGPKYWRDNATIWNTTRQEYEYVVLDRDMNGRWLSTTIGSPSKVWSILSPSAANFYRTYAAHFPTIPELVSLRMSREAAGSINFAAKGIPEDYPLGVDGGFPANCALRFNPTTVEPEVFNFEDYTRAFPINWEPTLPAIPGTGGKLSDEELVGAANGALASTMSMKDKAAAIRALANR